MKTGKTVRSRIDKFVLLLTIQPMQSNDVQDKTAETFGGRGLSKLFSDGVQFLMVSLNIKRIRQVHGMGSLGNCLEYDQHEWKHPKPQFGQGVTVCRPC